MVEPVFCCFKWPSFRRKSAPPPEHSAVLELCSPGSSSNSSSSTSDYSCAASQNTKINKQSQRFCGPFVWLNKCLNPLLWLHFALTSSSCASLCRSIKEWSAPSVTAHALHPLLQRNTHTHIYVPYTGTEVYCYFNPWNKTLFEGM